MVCATGMKRKRASKRRQRKQPAGSQNQSSIPANALTVIALNNSKTITAVRDGKFDKAIAAAGAAVFTKNWIISDDGQLEVTDLEWARGLASFTFRNSGKPVLLSYTCWNTALNRQAWTAAQVRFLKVIQLDPGLDANAPDRDLRALPPVPWLAEIQLRDFTALPDTLAILVGHVQASIVWALMDIEKESPSSK